MQKKRIAGILMPISSLPAPYGIGTIGKSGRRFIDWLADAGMKIWQILPLLPTGFGDSPYQSCASNALNYYFIDFEELKKEGLLKRSDYASIDWGDDPRAVDYGKIFQSRKSVLQKAFARFDKTSSEWQAFLKEGKYLDFAVFMSLKNDHGHRPWTEWGKYRKYSEEKVRAYIRSNLTEVEFWQFTQYIFLKQWFALKTYANQKGVKIIGDMPIYVAFDSVEMWKYGKQLFYVDKRGLPTKRAGVPPDAFSDDGQLWGNPVYNWNQMKKDGYAWWNERINYALTLFDYVRIDHFRAFDRYYAVDKDAVTAKEGRWYKGVGRDFFKDKRGVNIIAEDLGIIDDSVRKLLKYTGYPGMRVLEFAFDGNRENSHKPSTFTSENCIVYPGTHDNMPFTAYIRSLEGWQSSVFETDLKNECKIAGIVYRGRTAEEKCQTSVRLALASKAFMAILPMQDVLNYGEESRLNAPSTLSMKNWSYRFLASDFKKKTSKRLKELALRFGR